MFQQLSNLSTNSLKTGFLTLPTFIFKSLITVDIVVFSTILWFLFAYKSFFINK